MKILHDRKKFFEDEWREFSTVEKFVEESFIESVRETFCC